MLKSQKMELAKQYLGRIQGAKNAVILQYYGIPVNEINKVRMDVIDQNGNMEVVKKRVFIKSVEGSYDGLTLDQVPGAIVVLYSHNDDDQHAPLKVISKAKKIWKKAKANYVVDYIGAWYDGQWHDADYVRELADLPSKEELIGKFLFLLNHPMSSFARVLNAIAEKEGGEVEAPAETVTPEVTEATTAEETPAVEQKEKQESEGAQAE